MEESIEYKLSEFTKYLMALESRIQDAENTRKIAEEARTKAEDARNKAEEARVFAAKIREEIFIKLKEVFGGV